MHNVVVLGGGYAGISFTKKILKIIKKRNLPIKVYLIDRNEYQALLPLLPKCLSNLDAKVLIKFSDVLSNFGENFQFIQGEIAKVSISDNKIFLADGREVGYDDLVICIGAQPNDFGIKGVKENAIMFWNEKDTINYIRKLMSFTDKGISPRVVIVGGGPVGLEVASETFVHLKKLSLSPNILVVEAKERILPSLPEELSRSIGRFLERRGIKFETNCPVCNVYDNKIVSSNGREFEYDILVWSSGIKANDVISRILEVDLERGPQGKLVTDEFFRVKGLSNVWAIGDSCVSDKYGINFTNLAQFAIQMSKYCAINVANSYLKKDLVPARLSFKGIVIQLSKFKASAYIPKPFKIIIPPSIIGVVLRNYIDLNYLLSVGAFGKVRSLKDVTGI